jgi:NAD-dependent deacetylase
VSDTTGAPVPSAFPSHLEALRPHIQQARNIVVVTGAGMSAESGVPTFRDAQHALWADYDPYQLATPDAWRRSPERVWAWYEWRRAKVMSVQPHAGHLALARWAQQRPLRIVTQNVDDLHERAGNQAVIHVHGSLFAPRCSACARPGQFSSNVSVSPEHPVGRLPTQPCEHCGGRIRPGVVWFNEQMPEQPWSDAVAAVEQADLLLVVGTSAAVYPAASFPEIALDKRVPVLVINPNETEHTKYSGIGHWAATAAQALPTLVDISVGQSML